jgi:hypothetical protein
MAALRRWECSTLPELIASGLLDVLCAASVCCIFRDADRVHLDTAVKSYRFANCLGGKIDAVAGGEILFLWHF